MAMDTNRLQATAWHIQTFPGLGDFVVTTDGCKLFRVGEGTILLYNKNRHEEVAIDIEALHRLVSVT